MDTVIILEFRSDVNKTTRKEECSYYSITYFNMVPAQIEKLGLAVPRPSAFGGVLLLHQTLQLRTF